MVARKKESAEDFLIKAKRAPKDPNAPKNPKSAYLFFATQCRKQLGKSKPNLSFTDMGREVGKKWQAMADKSKWEKMALQDKQRYDREMKNYQPDADYLALQAKLKAQGTRLAKDPNKPKRGRTAYLVFCDIHRVATRNKYPNLSMTDVSAKLAEKWSVCSASERAKCVKVAEKEKANFEAAKANYVPSLAYRKAQEIVNQGKIAKVKKEKEGSAKAKENVKKQKMRVKMLKAEILSMQRKINAAMKLEEKLAVKQELLEKVEAKLYEIMPPSQIVTAKAVKVKKAPPAKKTIGKKKKKK